MSDDSTSASDTDGQEEVLTRPTRNKSLPLKLQESTSVTEEVQGDPNSKYSTP
jgi:hypothetical protein